jgi:hypothetical protein
MWTMGIALLGSLTLLITFRPERPAAPVPETNRVREAENRLRK